MKKRTHMIIVEIGKKIDKVFGYLGLILIGVVFGYAWAWIALN